MTAVELVSAHDGWIQFGVLDERLAYLSGCLEPVRISRQNRAASADSEDLRIVDARRGGARRAEGPRRLQQTATRTNDHGIARSEVLFAPVEDRPFAFGDRMVLLNHTGDAGKAFPSALLFAIDP